MAGLVKFSSKQTASKGIGRPPAPRAVFARGAHPKALTSVGKAEQTTKLVPRHMRTRAAAMAQRSS